MAQTDTGPKKPRSSETEGLAHHGGVNGPRKIKRHKRARGQEARQEAGGACRGQRRAAASRAAPLRPSPSRPAPAAQPCPARARSGSLRPPGPPRPGGSAPAPRAPPCALGLAQRRRRRRSGGRAEAGRTRSRWAGCGPAAAAAASGGRQVTLEPVVAGLATHHGLQHEKAGVGRRHLLYPGGAGEAVRPGPGAAVSRGPDVGRAGSTPTAEPRERRRSPSRLPTLSPLRGHLSSAHPRLLRCPGERKSPWRRATLAAPSVWPGDGAEPRLGPAAYGSISAQHFDPLGYPAVPATAQGPDGGSAEEGRGHQAVPASLPLPSSDSGSGQALAGLSPGLRTHSCATTLL